MRWIVALIFSFLCAPASAGFGIFQANGGAPPSCPFGSARADGCPAAPAGTAQFSGLLGSYPKSPHNDATPWNVAGVDYPVGINTNATSSGNTITETGVTNAPVNGDQKTFYPPMNASWTGQPPSITGSVPSGITIGTAYFVCGVSGSSATYSYTLSTASNCSSTVTLGALAASFIALKDPLHTTNLPSVGGGGSWPLPGNQQILIAANNITIDHFDFSLQNGWFFRIGASGDTFTNNYQLTGSNGYACLFLDGNSTSPTVNYNVCNGNGINVGGNQVVVNSQGTMTWGYNLIENTWAEFLQTGTQSSNSTTYIFQFSVGYNAGYGGCSGVHADWIQQANNATFSLTQITYSFYANYQTVVFCGDGTQGLSMQSANVAQGPVLGETISNTVQIATGANTTGYMTIIDTSNLNGSATFSSNYIDPTGTAFGALFTGPFNGVGAPGRGIFNGTVTCTNSFLMTTGSAVTC